MADETEKNKVNGSEIERRLKIIEAKIEVLAHYCNHYKGYELSPLREEFIDIDQKFKKKGKSE